MRQLFTVVVVMLLLQVPSGGASAPVEGDLRFDALAHALGRLNFTTEDGVLDLSRAAGAVDLRWGRASGWLVEREWIRYEAGAASLNPGLDEPLNETLRFDGGSLHHLTCQERCRILALGIGHGGSVGLEGTSGAPFSRIEEDVVFWEQNARAGVPDAFQRRVPAGALSMATSPAPDAVLGVEDGRGIGVGRIALLVVNATLVANGSEGPTTIDTTHEEEPVLVAGLDTGKRVTSRFAYLVLEDAWLEVQGAPVTLFAPGGAATLDGTLTTTNASGWIASGGTRHSFDHARVDVEGQLILRMDPPVQEIRSPLLSDLPLQIRFSGEAERVRIGDTVVHEPAARGAVELATAATALGVLALVVSQLPRFIHLLPFYTRIDRKSILTNRNRRRIFETLRKSPGLHASALAEQVGIARVVVQHHLRHLEAHRLIETQDNGRRRNYFVTGEMPSVQAREAGAALAQDARRKVAERLNGAGAPVTQKELVMHLGMPQRTVSYHLAKLEEKGLVLVDRGNPTLYRPTALLNEHVAAHPREQRV